MVWCHKTLLKSVATFPGMRVGLFVGIWEDGWMAVGWGKIQIENKLKLALGQHTNLALDEYNLCRKLIYIKEYKKITYNDAW